MELYGLFLGVDATGYFIKLEPIVKVREEVDGNRTIKYPDETADGLLDLSDFETTIDIAKPQASYQSDESAMTASDNADNYRFMQAKGFLAKHRPCYMVTEHEPT